MKSDCTTMRKFYSEEVLPLLRSRFFCGFVAFFVVLGYGYYLVNPSVSKDGFWLNMGSMGYDLPLRWSMQMRWGAGLCGWLTSLFGLSTYVSGVVGLAAMGASCLLVVAMLNRLTRSRNMFFSAGFSVLTMTCPLYSELLVYPNYMTSIGVGMLLTSLAAVLFLFYTETGDKTFFWRCGILWGFSLSIYETFLPHLLVLVGIFWFVGQLVGKTRRPSVRELLPLSIVAVIAVLFKYTVGGVIYAIERFTDSNAPEMFNGMGCGISWINLGLGGGFLRLVRDIVREFGFRAFTYFPVFVAILSVAVFLVGASVLARKKKNVWILMIGGAVIMSVFFFPIFQGSCVGYRTVMPMLPLLLAVEVHGVQFLKPQTIAKTILCIGLVIYVSNLSVVLGDVCIRYDLDKANALFVLHDLDAFRGSDKTTPVCIIGTMNAGQMEDTPVAYNALLAAKPARLEKFTGWKFVNGGGAGLGTLLTSTKHQRHEMYQFFRYLGGHHLPEPCDSVFADIEKRLQAGLVIPDYPAVGYITHVHTNGGEVIVVNLGRSRMNPPISPWTWFGRKFREH